LTATAGPNNNNSTGYYYIGAIRIAFNGNIGLEENVEVSLKLYPNPARHELNLNTGDGSLIRSVELLNINGTLVKQLSPDDAFTTINVESLASGLYWVRVQTDRGTAVSKVIIE
ncbi:MAG: T9SS type A sorting domain-containing protein, partial [Owenweeksia sp.]